MLGFRIQFYLEKICCTNSQGRMLVSDPGWQQLQVMLPAAFFLPAARETLEEAQRRRGLTPGPHYSSRGPHPPTTQHQPCLELSKQLFLERPWQKQQRHPLSQADPVRCLSSQKNLSESPPETREPGAVGASAVPGGRGGRPGQYPGQGSGGVGGGCDLLLMG